MGDLSRGSVKVTVAPHVVIVCVLLDRHRVFYGVYAWLGNGLESERAVCGPGGDPQASETHTHAHTDLDLAGMWHMSPLRKVCLSQLTLYWAGYWGWHMVD